MACPHCGGEHPADTKDCPLTGRPVPPRRPALAPGELLEGKYQIKRELGRGAMGIVYEALHVALGRRVAVKTLIEGTGADTEMGARFEREARAASAIGHPHIIDVFDLGRTKDGLLFMVMELLDGKALESILKQRPKLPVKMAVDVMSQVLSGLSAAHKNGIVHRDLKPDNIFIVDSEERPNFVKIVDFGISKVLGPQSASHAGTGKFAGTMVGSVLGTPLYMSPEQAIGQVAAIDHRTDIYSAGVVLYEMLCGRTPFAGKSYPEVLGQILEGKYQKPSELRPDLPPEIEAAIARALSRDIEARYPTAAAMRADIAGQTEITLAPVPLDAPVDQASPQVGSPPAAPAAAEGEPLVLAERTPAPRPSARRGTAPRADPFAPPPEAEVAPALAVDRSLAMRPSGPGPRPEPAPRPSARRGAPGPDRFAPPAEAERAPELALDRSVALRPSPSRPRPEPYAPEPSPPVARPRPARPESPVRQQTAVSAEEAIPSGPRKKRPWLLIAFALLALAIGVRVAYSFLGADGKSPLLPRIGTKQRISLVVEPKEASVQIDHVPVTAGAVPIDGAGDRTHVLNAAAPGRITRRFSFRAEPGMKLTVRLSHTLEVPGPADPPPLPVELDADYPESPRPSAEIDAAFAKLGHYADCLPLLDDQLADGKKGRARPRDELVEPCKLAVTEAAATEPDLQELQAGGEAFLAGLQKGAKPEAFARTASAFRAEYVAARAIWQIEELSRQEKDEGQSAAWHMRRVALAAQAWLRSRKAGPASPQVVEDRRAKLDAAWTTFMGFVRGTPKALAQTSGATDFVSAAEDVVGLANGTGGRKATEFSALDACRKVTQTFNALVVE